MRVLVTGHDGYIGRSLVPMLLEAGHQVTGLDTLLYRGCFIGDETAHEPSLQLDIRDVTAGDLAGQDAVIHLAALSNDPLGELDPRLTLEINYAASVRLAASARAAGVERFLFSSSCSTYGSAPGSYRVETDALNPVTTYGVSKVLAEEGIRALATDTFSPVMLRNATAYGVNERLRGDLVVNNLVGYAYATGEVLIKSDGSPWRPLIHVDDIARAFVAMLSAPRSVVHNGVFNVGATRENYQVRDVAEIVRDVVPGSRIVYAAGASPDIRDYRVDCDRLASLIPDGVPQWTVRQGVEQLYAAYRDAELTLDEFVSGRFLRIRRVTELLDAGEIDDRLRRTPSGLLRPRGRHAAA